ncbi:hypothetical protein GDO81_025698 [Engystomops pustulosus]|uniref:Uncharacterized protein n=1 Tax=Engystomops pustulosus TaxID=76066 RepID=A0AAV6ZJF9_ENGPU|nr:hypothetical protein GDO81_025698 [Engystomops pustulosus]
MDKKKKPKWNKMLHKKNLKNGNPRSTGSGLRRHRVTEKHGILVERMRTMSRHDESRLYLQASKGGSYWSVYRRSLVVVGSKVASDTEYSLGCWAAVEAKFWKWTLAWKLTINHLHDIQLYGTYGGKP